MYVLDEPVCVIIFTSKSDICFLMNEFCTNIDQIRFTSIVFYCLEGVVIAAQCTTTFSDLLGFPEFRYY